MNFYKKFYWSEDQEDAVKSEELRKEDRPRD